MSAAEWQEGAGGALRVDGLQDGGRVNNTQLIALFPCSWGENIYIYIYAYTHCHRADGESSDIILNLSPVARLAPNTRMSNLDAFKKKKKTWKCVNSNFAYLYLLSDPCQIHTHTPAHTHAGAKGTCWVWMRKGAWIYAKQVNWNVRDLKYSRKKFKFRYVTE